MREVWRKIKTRFLRHELWVLTNSIQSPLFSLFLTLTLFVWIFLPAIAISLPLIQFLPVDGFSIEYFKGTSKVLFIFGWGIGLTVLMIGNIGLFIWWGRWYLISIGLMMGLDKRAEKKQFDIQVKLKALTNV